MATKAELLEQAQSQGLDVNTRVTKSDLESMLSSETSDSASEAKDERTSTPSETSANSTTEARTESETAFNSTTEPASSVTVNENENGEATNGTTREGDESPIQNGESIPQNGIDSVDTSVEPTDGDKNRTEQEIAFADEGNPDNKARKTGAGGGDYDQDGNLRTGGKSYGVADDSNSDVSPDVFRSNRGEEPERSDRVSEASYFNPVPGSDQDTNNSEWDEDRQHQLEESLSEPDEGIVARVTTSTGDYVRVKFFRNGLPLGTYKSRAFDESKAREYLQEQKASRGL